MALVDSRGWPIPPEKRPCPVGLRTLDAFELAGIRVAEGGFRAACGAQCSSSQEACFPW